MNQNLLLKMQHTLDVWKEARKWPCESKMFKVSGKLSGQIEIELKGSLDITDGDNPVQITRQTIFLTSSILNDPSFSIQFDNDRLKECLDEFDAFIYKEAENVSIKTNRV